MFLFRGSQGSLVKALQERLNQLGYDAGPGDGVFGPRTYMATLKCQKDKGLNVDGVVGDQTWRVLFGTSVPEMIPVLNEPPPERLCFDVFGDFRLAGWKEQSLVKCDLATWRETFEGVYFSWLSPESKAFVHVDWFGFVCHRLVVTKFQMAFGNLVTRGLAGELKTFDGCFSPRLKRGIAPSSGAGAEDWSTHSWAIAVDLNAPWNAFGQTSFEMSKEFARCFNDAGFVWGGDWSYPDAMHFQYCTVR
ncbi:MAG: peptidoglycan-binding protein [Candidatus Zixiibacteriota bacterium]